MAKWPPIGGWLLIRVAAHSRFYCSETDDSGGLIKTGGVIFTISNKHPGPLKLQTRWGPISTLTTLEYFCINHGDQLRFFSGNSSFINVLDILCKESLQKNQLRIDLRNRQKICDTS